MKKTMNLIFCIFFSLLIIGSSTMITVGFKQLYYFDINYLNISEQNNLTKEEIKINYDYMIDYNLNKISGEFDLPTIKSSPEGKVHFEEVKEIIQNVIKLLIVSLIITIIGIIANLKNNNIEFLNITSKLVIILPILVSIPMLINFDKTFVAFHELMFDNDYWIFDPSKDPVINILPQEFFFHAGLFIVMLILLSSVILHIIYKRYNNKR
ncbi:TIGR01906 family membrane protein [Romboutsia ilealis]|uniref:TIGR01906 family membrane protein n=1 Tax=Romboutsia faecis TaxID=2764597 RepID=A0ABR7JRJ3_9FIRM|nr:TIGR01906 family membrane protein [Romboutsia faecis]MBC5997540.1 TIGR01906 family membrane protein [Romboutsia faecis]MRN24827.1 TIGR01906 family membrane protein [Romboutsia ilealis]